MKWFIALLVVAAAGLIAAALSVPTNAAVVNGTAISQQSLNSDMSAIAASAEYQCYLNSQQYVDSNGQQVLPPVVGAGRGQNDDDHPTVTTAFVASYLDTEIGHQLVLQLASARHVSVTSAQLAAARTTLTNQISEIMSEVAGSGVGQSAEGNRLTCGSANGLSGSAVLDTMPSSFVDQQVQFLATADALQQDLSGIGSSDADLRAYFVHHASQFDTVCWSAAEYSSESDAAAARAQVAGGTPFSQVLKSAAQGGQQPCTNLYELTEQLPAGANVAGLAVNQVSAPIALSDGTYVLAQLTSRMPTTFETAKSYVSTAVLRAGASKAQAVVTVVERHAHVSVDPRYGHWVPDAGQVLTPFTPQSRDVLNPAANSAALSSAAANPPSG